ncbi:putative polyol transporter 4 [Colletotrichum tanaceti]|nr:putative polyol transporter 4 [Colletotrichum tanaceti]
MLILPRVGFFMRFWQSSVGYFWGWRLSILLEIVPALVFGLGLPWIPETPRWLVDHGRKDQARSTLRWLREGSFDDDQIEQEFAGIAHDVNEYHLSGTNWFSLFREKPLFARLWRATLLQFMAQICGASGIKYYLPFLLSRLGLDMSVALLASAIEMTIKIFFTVLEMFIIDRFGRRNCLAAGCVVMAFSLLINGALPLAYGHELGDAASAVCIVFIFVYAMGFSIGFGPAAWVYNTEIFPTAVRARGLNFASVGGSIGASIVSMIWGYGMDALGSNLYFVFMVINIICIPTFYTFLPETNGRELEDMDALFGAVDKPRTNDEGASAHLLLNDTPYRDSEDSLPVTTSEEDR